MGIGDHGPIPEWLNRKLEWGTRRLKPSPWKSGSHQTPRWREQDSNPRSRNHGRYSVLGIARHSAVRRGNQSAWSAQHRLRVDASPLENSRGYSPFSTISSKRCPMTSLSVEVSLRSGPSVNSMASPRTADHARYSEPGRRSG